MALLINRVQEHALVWTLDARPKWPRKQSGNGAKFVDAISGICDCGVKDIEDIDWECSTRTFLVYR